MEARAYKGWYYLDANCDPQPVTTEEQMIAVHQDARRLMHRAKVADAEVSTVFLGLDCAMGGDHPILYETMVFGGKMDQDCVRYSTRKKRRLDIYPCGVRSCARRLAMTICANTVRS